MSFDVSRLRRSDRIIGIGAIALFIFLFFFKWYGYSSNAPSLAGVNVNSSYSIDGWHAFQNSRWIWIITIIVALVVVAIASGALELKSPVQPGVLVAGLGALSALTILYRIIHHPTASASFGSFHASVGIKIGIWLGLIAAAATTYGGYLKMQEEGTSLSDVRDQASQALSSATAAVSSPSEGSSSAVPAPASATAATPPASDAPAPPPIPPAPAPPALRAAAADPPRPCTTHPRATCSRAAADPTHPRATCSRAAADPTRARAAVRGGLRREVSYAAPRARGRVPIECVAVIDRDEVLHVARLARLRLSEEELEPMARELSAVLDHIAKIAELDLDDVAPTTHVVEVSRCDPRVRDEPRGSLPREVALAQAPAVSDEGFSVPSPQA